MKKNAKILLGSFAGLAVLGGAAAGLAVGLTQNSQTSLNSSTTFEDKESVVDSGLVNEQPASPVENEQSSQPTESTENGNSEVVNTEENDTKINTEVVETENASTFAMVSSYNVETKKYTLKLENNESQKGAIKFVVKDGIQPITSVESEETTSEITANPGDYVFVQVVANPGYTLKQLKVYGDNSNIMLGVHQLSGWEQFGLYSFQIPNEGDDENPFKPDTSDTNKKESKAIIHIEASFTLQQIASWSYNFNYRSYVLDLTDDLILDDSNESLNLIKFKDEELGTYPDDTINFIIFLNGNKLSVGTFTIPHGITLTLVKNKSLNNDLTSVATVELEKNKTSDHGNQGFRVGGALAEYSGVKVTAPINSIYEFGAVKPR